VLGGTFNPIHNGHLAIAEAVLYKFNPQKVLFVPCGIPPHKPNTHVIDGEHRYQMVLLATCEHPGFDASRLEILRGGTSYTIDTIKFLRSVCPPDATIYFVMGADSLDEILTWKDAHELLKLCEFIAVTRHGYKFQTDIAEHFQKTYGATIHLMEEPLLEISGSNIRERFNRGLPVRGLMPRPSEDYARRNNLYSSYNHFDWAMEQVKSRLSSKRFKHTLGVLEEAETLAKHYGADVEKARWAALLHDCAKQYSADKKRTLCNVWNLPLDEVLSAHISLAHGLIGAESAKRDFYIDDPEIMQAIKYHTTGHKKMTLLDKVIMLADYIEPYREDYTSLDEIRKYAYTNMDKALYIGTKGTIEDEKSKGNAIHHWSKDALKVLKKTM
jgi:nicotinate-nucleotide adenylyltransferase